MYWTYGRPEVRVTKDDDDEGDDITEEHLGVYVSDHVILSVGHLLVEVRDGRCKHRHQSATPKHIIIIIYFV